MNREHDGLPADEDALELERYRAELRRPDVSRLLERAESFTVTFSPDGRVERVRARRRRGAREAPARAQEPPSPWEPQWLADGTFGIPAAARLREAHNGK